MVGGEDCSKQSKNRSVARGVDSSSPDVEVERKGKERRLTYHSSAKQIVFGSVKMRFFNGG